MKIGEKEYSEIFITDSDNNLLASITDKDIIEEQNCKVVCVPVEDSRIMTEEKAYVTGERRFAVLLGGKELYLSNREKDKAVKLKDEIDITIKNVCEGINKNEGAPECYADTVKALAALVEARVKLN